MSGTHELEASARVGDLIVSQTAIIIALNCLSSCNMLQIISKNSRHFALAAMPRGPAETAALAIRVLASCLHASRVKLLCWRIHCCWIQVWLQSLVLLQNLRMHGLSQSGLGSPWAVCQAYLDQISVQLPYEHDVASKGLRCAGGVIAVDLVDQDPAAC